MEVDLLPCSVVVLHTSNLDKATVVCGIGEVSEGEVGGVLVDAFHVCVNPFVVEALPRREGRQQDEVVLSSMGGKSDSGNAVVGGELRQRRVTAVMLHDLPSGRQGSRIGEESVEVFAIGNGKGGVEDDGWWEALLSR